jgi:hypothetical protein
VVAAAGAAPFLVDEAAGTETTGVLPVGAIVAVPVTDAVEGPGVVNAEDAAGAEDVVTTGVMVIPVTFPSRPGWKSSWNPREGSWLNGIEDRPGHLHAVLGRTGWNRMDTERPIERRGGLGRFSLPSHPRASGGLFLYRIAPSGPKRTGRFHTS